MLRLENPEAENLLVASLLQDPEALASCLPLMHKANGAAWMRANENAFLVSLLLRYAKEHSTERPPSRAWLMHQITLQAEQLWPTDPGQPEAEREKSDSSRQAAIARYEILLERRFAMSVTPGEAKVWAQELAGLYRDREVIALLTRVGQEIAQAESIADKLVELRNEASRLLDLTLDSPITLCDQLDPDMVAADLQEYRNRRDHPELYRGWPTGFFRLDAELNGLRPGEMGAIIGATGAGKSSLLRDFGITAAQEGAHVCLVSAEVSQRICRDQLNAALTRTPIKKLAFGELSDTELLDMETLLMRAREQMRGSFHILDVPENCVVANVEQILSARFQRRFDVVLWDHLGLMQPNQPGRGGRYDWGNVGAIANDIRVFSRSQPNAHGGYGVASWVACQDNPKNTKKKVEDVGAGDVSLSYLITWPCSAVIHILADSLQQQRGEAILKVSKARHGEAHWWVRVETELALGRFLGKQHAPDEFIAPETL